MDNRPPIMPPALGLLMMLAVFTVHFIKPVALIFPHPMNFIGLVPIALGALLNILADKEFRKAGLIDDDGQINKAHQILVTGGVFRFSRNPKYLGLALIIAGLAMWAGSLSAWLVVLVFPVILYSLYIRKEEQRMKSEFGERYAQYCSLVPRWINLNLGDSD